MIKSFASNTKRRIVYFVAALLLIGGLYLTVAPLIPGLQYWWGRAHGFNQPTYVTNLLQHQVVKSTDIPTDNRLIIPSIGLNEAINEGNSLDVANNGLWRVPYSSTPPESSNTVIVGHRFSYSPNIARAFYNLDKVKVGEELIVYWRQKGYIYRVSSISVVAPQQTSIEQPSTDNRLTLYTCTPLWTSKNRLVVVANLEK